MAALDGIVNTRVGYSGGIKPSPSYKLVCTDSAYADYVEAVQLDYDPTRIEYEDVLDAFFRSHDATARGRGRQYSSVIFVHDAEHEAIAARKLQGLTRVATTLEPLLTFYDAEAYHQKWLLQRKRHLFMSLQLKDEHEIVSSPAASLLNAFAAQRLNCETLEARLAALASVGLLEAETLDAIVACARSHSDAPIVMFG